jgi:hypothetical protein
MKTYYIDYDHQGNILAIYWELIHCKHNILSLVLPDDHPVLENSFNYCVQGNQLKLRIIDYEVIEIEQNKELFRQWRSKYLGKYDLLGLWVLRGDIDPITGLEYAPITDAERQWRVAVLNFTDNITAFTTPSQYPTVPTRLL